MKIKKILSWIGLLLLACSIIMPFQTKADKLDFTDLFSWWNPLSDDSYVRLLNEYDTSRWYADTSDIECSDDSNLKISFSILDDADLYTVRFYHLVVSPYRMEQLRNWDQSIDMSKIIMKEINRNSSKKVSYNISEIEWLNRNQAYYGFLVPTDDYDTVWTPSKEIVIPLDSAEYEPTDIICQAKTNRITLKPWLNTFSTPAVLKSLTFSNGWNNISFAKMEKWKWTPVTFTNNNVKSIIRPLDGFIIRNSNSTDITMTIEYDTDIDINDALHQKQLDAWWNFLWITKTNNPFSSIANAIAMDIIDFTIWNSNKIDLSNLKDATSFMLWKAYGVFVNNSNWIYGWRNNQENLNNLINCDDAAIQLACSIGSGFCPNNCNYPIRWNLEWDSDYNRSDELFVEWRTSAKVLFKWTYTAEWWDIYLDRFSFIDKNLNTFQWGFEWRLIIYIDWNRQEFNLNGLWKWFVNVELDNIVKVEEGESISIDITFTQDWYRNKVNENARWDCSYINQYIFKLSGIDDYNERIQSTTAETSPIYYSTQTQAELKNNLESTVTFSEWWASKVVFSGTYKAEIGDLSINSFNVKVWNPENCSENTDVNWGILFHLYVNWEEVETSAWMLIDRCTTEATVYFDEINIDNWESVSIKIIWEFLWNIPTWQHNYMVTLTNSNSCFERLFTATTEWMAPIKIVDNTQCLGMDRANVNHIVNGNIITLRWTAVDGDYVTISLFNPNTQSYQSLWTVDMDEEKFDYEKQWNGEHNFTLTNGCREIIYKADA